jgi:GMP synthase (glutamine-hydrolysing)
VFTPSNFVSQAIASLSALKGDAVIAVSGGIDSTVAAALCHKAFGKRLHPVFVDTGFLRKGETEQVNRVFSRMGIEIKIVDASDRFFTSLEGVSDPEIKRKTIGESFIRIFEKEAAAFDAEYLIQGTIAPDWIESGSGIRDTIKSHHNVGGLPEKFGLKLVEPLRDLYKDEVRAVAKELKIEQEGSWKQPFPGPGLAIRVIGEVTRERVDICREANAIVCEEIYSAFEKNEIPLPWQYFAALLASRSTGVQGDVRAYGYTIAIRAVEASDGMTARYSQIPHSVLERISRRITNSMKDKVNRVVYDVTDKPPATIEWE